LEQLEKAGRLLAGHNAQADGLIPEPAMADATREFALWCRPYRRASLGRLFFMRSLLLLV